MTCDMRDKGESEEQSGFGSHCEREEEYNIYSGKSKKKGFQSMKGRMKEVGKSLLCKEREVCETEVRKYYFEIW